MRVQFFLCRVSDMGKTVLAHAVKAVPKSEQHRGGFDTNLALTDSRGMKHDQHLKRVLPRPFGNGFGADILHPFRPKRLAGNLLGDFCDTIEIEHAPTLSETPARRIVFHNTGGTRRVQPAHRQLPPVIRAVTLIEL